MKKILMVYTSMTGNTELMAFAIRDALLEAGADLTVQEAFDAEAEDLLDFDGILIGTHTWEGGEIPDEFYVFFDDLDGLDLSGKKAAVFGSGDSFYTRTFGMALDKFKRRLERQGAEIVRERLLCDLDPGEEELEQCRAFAKGFLEAL